jgi:hypothetical protein
MYSKYPSMMKTTGREKMMFCRKLTFLPKTTRTDSEDISHQDGLTQLRYQNSFLGYCFSCNHFGHKEIDCRAYARNNHVWNKNISTYGFSNRNYNSFAPLFDYNVVCYKCNNYGHITHFCRSGLVETSRQNREEDTLSKQKKEPTGVWKRKQEKEK